MGNCVHIPNTVDFQFDPCCEGFHACSAYVCCVLELVAGDSVGWNELRLEFESCLCGPKRLRNE